MNGNLTKEAEQFLTRSRKLREIKLPDICSFTREEIIRLMTEFAKSAAQEAREQAIEECKELLEDSGELLNLFASKLNIQVEGASLKSDSESYGAHEVLLRIKQLLNLKEKK